MSEEWEFFILLLEKYSEYKSESAREVLERWKNADIIPYINRMYGLYHIERLENAFEDIDRKLEQR